MTQMVFLQALIKATTQIYLTCCTALRDASSLLMPGIQEVHYTEAVRDI